MDNAKPGKKIKLPCTKSLFQFQISNSTLLQTIQILCKTNGREKETKNCVDTLNHAVDNSGYFLKCARLSLCRQASPWAWACRTGRGCVKVAKDSPVQEGDNMDNPTLAGCKLTCNDESVLWPKPRDGIYLSKTLVSFLPTDIRTNRINAPSSEVLHLTS